MTPMLELNHVWGHCDGSDPCPINDPCKAQNWDKAEKVAKTMNSVNIKPAQFVHVVQATTVKQIWENLASVHKI